MEIYENQQQQEPMYYEQPMQMPPQMQPQNIVQSSPEFMRFIFDFKKEVTIPLRHLWRGEELDEKKGWIKPPGELNPIMNERGIAWGISMIDSFINAVYIVSNYDLEAMNWTMKRVGKITWNNLTKEYTNYGLAKINIPRVAMEIISKIHAILLGARGDGYRTFFTQTTSINESRMVEQPVQRKSWFRNVGQGLLNK